MSAKMTNGSINWDNSEFEPIDKITRNDADMFIVFLSGNGVVFTEPSYDDWYRATRPLPRIALDGIQRGNDQQYYAMSEAASPLGCVQKYQFCHTALPEGKRCGISGSLIDAFNDLASHSSSHNTRTQIMWFYEQLSGIDMSDLLQGPGAQALTSEQSLAGNIQGHLPRNQWHIDVLHWWATYLSGIQSAFVEGTEGPADPRIQEFVVPSKYDYDNDTFHSICHNQVRNQHPTVNIIFTDSCRTENTERFTHVV